MDWRKGLGKPTTKVCLPSGDTFDARVISSNEKHSLNNKLGTKSEAIVHPGMRSNLKIDYSKQCEEYSNFVTGKTKSIKTPWEKKLLKESSVITIDDFSSTSSNEIEIIDPSDFAKKTAAKSKDQVHQELLNSMHNRVVSRARSQLTKKIKESIDSTSTVDEDEEQIQLNNQSRTNDIRRLKHTIQLLEISCMNNSNINAMRSVTNDGKDLVDSSDGIKTVTSEDVLQRLEVYHEIE